MDINLQISINENEEAEKLKNMIVNKAKREVSSEIDKAIKERVDFYIDKKRLSEKELDRLYYEKLGSQVEYSLQKRIEYLVNKGDTWAERGECREAFIVGCQAAYMVIQSGFDLEITKDDILKAIYKGSQERIESYLESAAIRKLKDDKKFITKIAKMMDELSENTEAV